MIVNPSENKFFTKKNTINYNGELIDLTKPLIMGILNLTPDSFYDGGKHYCINRAVNHVSEMLNQGAQIVDIGACSTRPGAELINEHDEIKRLSPVISQIRKEFPKAILSIDTFRSNVAKSLVCEFGDFIINDISGGTFDSKMFEVVADLKVPYILMHIQGTPETMHDNVAYKNVTKDVIKDLSQKVYRLHELGVCDVIVDPGFGFSKTIDHNYELFNNLDAFRFFELPLLIGISRKSIIFKLLNQTASDSLNGTTVLNTLALMAGANILRVHDVKAAVEAVEIIEKIKQFA